MTKSPVSSGYHKFLDNHNLKLFRKALDGFLNIKFLIPSIFRSATMNFKYNH